MSMIIEVPDGYETLGMVLQLAIDQAAKGKGADRHASGEPDNAGDCQSPC